MFNKLPLNIRLAIRVWARNRTRPMTVEEAEEKKYFWAKIYMYTGFAGFLFTSYVTFRGSSSSDISPTLAINKSIVNNMKENEKMRIIKFSGFTKTSDSYMTKEEMLKLAEESRKEKDTELLTEKV